MHCAEITNLQITTQQGWKTGEADRNRWFTNMVLTNEIESEVFYQETAKRCSVYILTSRVLYCTT